jgi:hypothetical protein
MGMSGPPRANGARASQLTSGSAPVRADGGPGGQRLVAENARLTDRAQRLGDALSNMSSELALARRENVALRRDNAQLRALLTRSQ